MAEFTAEQEARLAQLQGEVAAFDAQPSQTAPTETQPLTEPQAAVPEAAPAELTGVEAVSKALFPASTAAAEAPFTPDSFAPTTSVANLKETGKSALTAAGDVLGLATRGLSGIQKGLSAKDGEGFNTFVKTLQDQEAGIFKGSREESNAFYNNLIQETENPLLKIAYSGIKFLAEASIGVIEDPASIVTGATKLAQKGLKTISKSAPALKATVASQSGIPQEALELASKEKVKDIGRAAGTEKELAGEIASTISPAGEKSFLSDLKGKQKSLESELDIEGVQVGLKQPTKEVDVVAEGVGGTVTRPIPDPSKKLIDPKTGKEIDFPVDFLEKVGESEAFSRVFTTQLKNISEDAAQIAKVTKSKGEISTGSALRMKKEFQAVLRDKYGKEGKGIYDNILKGFTASVRASIESSALKAGKPEYVELMREIAKNKSFFEKTRGALTGKKADFGTDKPMFSIKQKLESIMNKSDKGTADVLKDLDEIFNNAGIPSDFANKANLAAIAKKTGIDDKGTVLTSLITTGKSAITPMLFAAFSPTGPMKGVAFLAGMASNSPLAARSMFQSLNLAEAASKSPKIQALINQLGKAATADAITRLMGKIETEFEKVGTEED